MANGLRLAVLENREILFGEIGNRLAATIENANVDRDERGRRPEGRLRGRLRRLLTRCNRDSCHARQEQNTAGAFLRKRSKHDPDLDRRRRDSSLHQELVLTVAVAELGVGNWELGVVLGSNLADTSWRKEAHMPPTGVKSAKRARQYEHIKDSEQKQGRSTKRAKQIAAATVNKQRREKGETKGSRKSVRKRSRKTSSRKTSGAKKTSSRSRKTSSSRKTTSRKGGRRKSSAGKKK